MAEKLKECPFCGSLELRAGHGTKDREGWPVYVYCEECGARGPWVYMADEASIADVALVAKKTAWNTRDPQERMYAGEIREFRGEQFQAIKGGTCGHCDFYERNVSCPLEVQPILGPCYGCLRPDGESYGISFEKMVRLNKGEVE